MGKKYIIEIPEDKIADFVGSTHFLMPYMMAGHIGHHDTGLPIKPYTEPDLEHVRKEAYEHGYYIGYSKYLNKSYNDGLSEAWDAARKIICEMDHEDYMKIFGGDNLDYIFALSPTTAIEKLKAYEREQEYRVGDEFENGDGQKFIVLKMDGKEIDRYIDGDGKTYVMKEKYRVMRKTGRHFPEIAAVLEKMRGEQE